MSAACTAARRRIAAREAGMLGRERAERLERHLAGCAACRRVAVIEARLTEELGALHAPYPFEIDVTRRVVAGLAGVPRDAAAGETSVRQLGLATGVAAALAASLLVATGAGLETILAGAREAWLVLSAIGGAGLALAGTAIELVQLPLRVVVRFVAELAAALDPVVDRWLPALLAVTGLAYAGMLVAMGRMIFRGFVMAPAVAPAGRSPRRSG